MCLGEVVVYVDLFFLLSIIYWIGSGEKKLPVILIGSVGWVGSRLLRREGP